jgi:hypothetical protein
MAPTSRTSVSPIWLRLLDVFTGAPPAGPVRVVVERRRDGRWEPLAVPSRLTGAGNLGFPDLGRSPTGTGEPLELRIALAAPRTVVESAAGDRWVRRTVPPWTAARPPAPPTPETVRFFPAPDYVFAPGVPVLCGTVVAASGDPADRARVSTSETVAGRPRVEEVRAGPDGGFRLPLRFSRSQARVDAALGSATGSVTVALPGGLSLRPVVSVA